MVQLVCLVIKKKILHAIQAKATQNAWTGENGASKSRLNLLE